MALLANISESDGDLVWLHAFRRQHGRPLRVLHLGNIANNAYLNAKFLRSIGIDAHVLSRDYYHVMATPEWEEVELAHEHGDDYRPHFSAIDVRDYRRPAWFVNAPLTSSPSAIAKLCGKHPTWRQRAASSALERLVRVSEKLIGLRGVAALQLLLMNPAVFVLRLSLVLKSKLGTESWVAKAVDACATWGLKSAIARLGRWVAMYDEAFPTRSDRLTGRDVFLFYSATNIFRKIFDRYDIVQCYATEPIHALLAEKRPFLAFEHGTLRDFTMDALPLHRLTALAYRRADHTFITNGDCLAYAKRLGVENYSPIIHPIDVDQHRRDFGGAITDLREKMAADVILFCPLRHEWKVKGVDIHLRALPLIKARVKGRVALVLIRWGQQISDSEVLVEDLGCAAEVVWRPSMCRITMIKHIRAADVVLDQMALPHFGATAPQSIAAGTPVISSYEPESTRWIIPEPAPILSAFSPEDVAAAVVTALDPQWRLDYKNRAKDWTDKYHHPNNVIRSHLSVYRRVLET
jgi:glycosyltransferase involved in cell wall biosynthesis